MKKTNPKTKYYPMLVPVRPGAPELTAQEDTQIWTAFLQLSQSTQDRLLSPELPALIEALGTEKDLKDAEVQELSRSIRMLFFGKITKKIWIERTAKLLHVAATESETLFEKLRTMPITPSQKESSSSATPDAAPTPSKDTARHTLEEARSRYKTIDDTLLTDTIIASSKFTKPLKPTLKNWVAVYEKFVGAIGNTPIDRGNYIFHHETTKSLSAPERERLSYILAAHDDPEQKITINTATNTLIFPQKTAQSTVSHTAHVKAPKPGTIPVTPLQNPAVPDTAHAVNKKRSADHSKDKVRKPKNSTKEPAVAFTSTQVLPHEEGGPQHVTPSQSAAVDKRHGAPKKVTKKKRSYSSFRMKHRGHK